MLAANRTVNNSFFEIIPPPIPYGKNTLKEYFSGIGHNLTLSYLNLLVKIKKKALILLFLRFRARCEGIYFWYFGGAFLVNIFNQLSYLKHYSAKKGIITVISI